MSSQQMISAKDYQRLANKNKNNRRIIISSENELYEANNEKGIDEVIQRRLNGAGGATGAKLSKNYKPTNKYILMIHRALEAVQIEYKKDYVFLTDRNFAFDVAIEPLSLKIAIEYEGIFSEKSRHISITGYTRDVEKYRRAVLDGWKLLRYTAIDLDKRNGEYGVVDDVKRLMNAA